MFPEVGLRQILPLLTESFSRHPKKDISSALQLARTRAHEERRLASVIPADKGEPAAVSSVHGEHVSSEKGQGVNEETITHAYLWPRVSSFFREGDVIVGETGTSRFGISQMPSQDIPLLIEDTLDLQ